MCSESLSCYDDCIPAVWRARHACSKRTQRFLKAALLLHADGQRADRSVALRCVRHSSDLPQPPTWRTPSAVQQWLTVMPASVRRTPSQARSSADCCQRRR